MQLTLLDGDCIWASFYVTFVRAVALLADDGITIPVPILLEGEESVVEFIDLPYSGVSVDFSCTTESAGVVILL